MVCATAKSSPHTQHPSTLSAAHLSTSLSKLRRIYSSTQKKKKKKRNTEAPPPAPHSPRLLLATCNLASFLQAFNTGKLFLGPVCAEDRHCATPPRAPAGSRVPPARLRFQAGGCATCCPIRVSNANENVALQVSPLGSSLKPFAWLSAGEEMFWNSRLRMLNLGSVC